jgi:hypothetical protein
MILIKTGFDEYFPRKISPFLDSEILHKEYNSVSSTQGGNESLQLEEIVSCKAIQLNRLTNFEGICPISDEA